MLKTEIANLALSYLATSLTISDLDVDNSLQGRVLRKHFNTSKKKVLAKHAWASATQYQALALTNGTAKGNWSFEYSYPSDAVVIREIAPDGNFPKVELFNEYKYKWEEISIGTNTVIWADVPNAHAKYTLNLHPDSNFQDHIGIAIAAQLAMDGGREIVTNNWPKIKDLLLSECKNEISEQIAIDLSRQPASNDSPNPFIAVRLF